MPLADNINALCVDVWRKLWTFHCCSQRAESR